MREVAPLLFIEPLVPAFVPVAFVPVAFVPVFSMAPASTINAQTESAARGRLTLN